MLFCTIAPFKFKFLNPNKVPYPKINSKITNVKEIPAIIRENDEKINSEISLIENIQRENLNPYEKAIRIKKFND